MDSIFFKDQGKGFPIVLLHGFCETHQIWDGLAEQLAKDFRVITLDLPGFGQSQLPPQPFTIDDIGDQLIGWLSKLKINKPAIIGHSLGGYVALAIAQKDRGLLSGLGLFHSTAFADSEEKKLNRDKTIDFVEKFGVPPFVETFVPGLFYQKDNPSMRFVRDMALTTPLETLTSYSKAMRDRPSREEFLRNYRGNILVAAGIYDSIIPFSMSQQVSVLAPNTMFCPLENTGHMGMFESQTDSLNSFIAFASKCEKGLKV
ncbi:MAG: alpha/beta fold hydrolase [Cyclobacteriaceae bacterium]